MNRRSGVGRHEEDESLVRSLVETVMELELETLGSCKNRKEVALALVENPRTDDWTRSKFEEFSKFLGFFMEEVEWDILNFFQKLPSRRERIYRKEMHDKTRFGRI